MSARLFANVIGLVPAAGQATRVSPLPMSKELYPVTLRATDSGARPKVVSHYLLESMRTAGIERAFIVLRDGKWDIPAYYKDGAALLEMTLAYFIMREPFGPPFTLDAALPFAEDAVVALGFPDIVFWPRDAFAPVLAKLHASGADAVLGLFPCDRPHTADMVELDADGRVRRLHIKQQDKGLRYTWAVAVWTPAFTRFMRDYLEEARASGEAMRREWHVGDVIQAAIDRGLSVDTVAFADGGYVDIGSPEILQKIHRGEIQLP